MNTPSDLARAARYTIPFVLLLIPLWSTAVNNIVPDPYLDEVFHVGQAQKYWAHNWKYWDQKITTPPGLYLWSYALCTVLRFLRGSFIDIGAAELRATNVLAAAVILPWRLQTLLDHLQREQNSRPVGAWVSHTVLNICLFPPLFFFSALYYTDILALVFVVESYIWDSRRSNDAAGKQSWPSILLGHASIKTSIFLLFSLAALLFRQTNIFWVAVFLGGLQITHVLHEVSAPCRIADFSGVVKKGLQNELYDPPIADASIVDCFKVCLSLLFVAFKNLPFVIISALPYIAILAVFGSFVLWNGGVVLGHKEFHSAGIHLPQMLYIWPYFAFFSWPLLLIPLINIIAPNAYLPKFLDRGLADKQKFPRILLMITIIAFMLLAVHFNTIVHPFTLADNRHYVFYIFRILLRYHPAVKYAVTPIYVLCAWATLIQLGAQTPPASPPLIDSSMIYLSAADNGKSNHREVEANQRSPREASPAPPRQALKPEIGSEIQAGISQQQQEDEQLRVSFVLVWLISTSLSVVTAPLVEPRYFIIPWVMWRLHLPRQSNTMESLTTARIANFSRLLETVWFVVVNLITGYMFLFKGFEWPQEPGKVQRFMW